MQKHLARKSALALLIALALLSLSACEQWINDEIMIVNDEAYDIRVHIEFEDGDRTEYQVIPAGQNHSFFTAYWDDDKYTPITIVAEDIAAGHIWESEGNIAANDWLTVAYFDIDFSHVY